MGASAVRFLRGIVAARGVNRSRDEFREYWRTHVLELSLLVHQYRGGAPVRARLEQAVFDMGVRFGALFLHDNAWALELIVIDLETGVRCEPPQSHWDQVAASMELTEDQLVLFGMLDRWWKSTTQEQRQALAARAAAAGAEADIDLQEAVAAGLERINSTYLVSIVACLAVNMQALMRPEQVAASWISSCPARNAAALQDAPDDGHVRGPEKAAQPASGYWTIQCETSLEVEVKKSQFLVTAWPVQSGDQAMRLIQEAGDPAASHNCFAWKVGAAHRSSDDGEPGGTAGRPILGAIEGDGLDGVAVLVTRHFGGIKLGSGGLVRAYGGAARDCLRAAPKQFVKRQIELRAECPFQSLGAVYGAMQRHGAAASGEEEYTESGAVAVRFLVDEDAAAAVVDAVSNATSGRVVPMVVPPDG
ncbi:IMPACT family member in pol 5'region [Monoraphidium neglectum]|uniref:IMPACT family member in pol 5'region n=1 Tax=Monoraphidium neglectum TaxID=145388 RepID=A0A0D2MX09_9CHLO|nr:IMPACT family member in pol 5'region [Monoraphidium neglectum]KIZ04972.1 IMPACT family member in pol 5'region [Monoraphidium neglectum]|eukprot:XP_013903991.1 IMPACT family member in pol 5'region [Monoraphidium neglectum]